MANGAGLNYRQERKGERERPSLRTPFITGSDIRRRSFFISLMGIGRLDRSLLIEKLRVWATREICARGSLMSEDRSAV